MEPLTNCVCWLRGPLVQLPICGLVTPSVLVRQLVTIVLGVVIPTGFTGAGVPIDCGEGLTLLFAKNDRLIADGKAVAMTLSTKGNSGLKPCSLCANVLMKGALSDMDNPGNKFVVITQPTLTGCIPNTNESLFKNADDLQRLHMLWQQKKLTKAKYEMTEKATGLKYNPQGLLWDLQLRSICPPMDFILEDWSHVYLCKGIGGDELWSGM